MIRLVDGTLDPFLGFLAGWSIRWGVLIVALAAWLLARPPRLATTRHLLCATVLAAGLVLPFAPRWTAPWPLPSPALPLAPPTIQPAIPGPERLAAPRRIAATIEPDRPPIASPTAVELTRPVVATRVGGPEIDRGPSGGPGAWRRARLGLGAAWLAGTVGLLIRLMIGGAILARLRSSSRPIAGAAFDDCRRELGSRRAVGLAAHPAVGSPVVLGGLRPTILVPDDWDGLPEASRRACLLHELAHVERRDDVMKLAAELARAPFWFHPAVGWLLARLDREAELACDEAAVGHGVAPRDLAHLLLAFARRPCRLDLRALLIGRQALSFFDRGTVSTRISRLLEDDMNRATSPPSRWKVCGLAASVAALAMAIGGARARAIGPDAPADPPTVAIQAPAPARSFAVVVKDEEGRPIEGVTVAAGVIEAEAGRDVTLARTGADGSARFDREPKEGIWVVAFKEGHSFASRNLFDPTGTIPTPLTLPRPQALSGTVADGEGRPVAGAEVRVEGAHDLARRRHYFAPALGSIARGTPIERAVTARSDARGNFRFESLPDGAAVGLTTSAEGKATTRTVRPPALANQVDAPVRVVLMSEARLAGRVVSAVAGVGVGGRPVTLQGVFEGASSTLAGKATTDAEGRFEIRGLAEGRANVFLDDVPADGPWTFRAASDVRLVSGATAEARIEIVEGVVVSGTVASPDGKPIAGVVVAAYGVRNPRTGSPPVSTATDFAGIYRFRLAPGDAFVTLNGRVAGYTTLGNGESSRDAVIPGGVKTYALPPFVMAPGVILRGRIVDAAGVALEGAKLIGVCNQAYCTPLNQASAVADAQGRFSLDTQADGQPIPLNQGVTFQVRLADGKEFDASVVPTGADAEVTIKLPTLRAGGPKGPEQVAPDEIAGVVVDARGRPIEGVLAHPYHWLPNFKVFSDAEGRFRVKLPERGKVEIRLTKEGHEPREFLGQATGQPGWVVVMGDRTYFEGRVLAPDGSPVADAPIRADSGSKRMGGGAMMTECWTEGRSGKDGRYRLYVESGMYEFQVRVPGVGVARLPGHSIASDEARPLDIRLAPGANFAARVVDSQDGKPIAGFVLKDWQNPVIAGTSDAEGTLRIPDMMPGRFSFDMIESEVYARWWSDACLSEWTRYQKAYRFGFQRNLDGLDFDMQPGMAPVTIHAERAATIRGVVLDPDGKPVAGATAAPALTGSGNSLTGDTRFSVETGKDGAFTMRLPASGAIEYNLVAHDGKYQEWRAWANGVLPPFRTEPGQVMEGVTLRLTRPATVTGRAVDAAGKPVAGREVRASAADKRENRYYDPTTQTGADGAFTLRFVRAGEQHIQVAPFWLYASGAPAGTSRTLTLAEGETKSGVDLTAGPGR